MNSLFLIDEPEISFNILWQEKYIDSIEVWVSKSLTTICFEYNKQRR